MNQQNKLPISVVIIAMNEELNIARAINSVQWADEVLVYDSGSTDKTVQVAENLGAHIIVGKWMGFGLTKKYASLKAKHNWILSLDCDEEVSLNLKNEIVEKLLSPLNEKTAYRIPRASFYLNKWIKYGGWYPDRQTRLFNKMYSNWGAEEIHEKVKAEQYENLSNNINHYVFRNIEHQVNTNNRYSSLQAQEMFRMGKKFSWLLFIIKPYVKFTECYLLKLGFLDGWAGYFIARSAAYSVFLKWSKLYEYERELSKKV
jgi:glycosyltransferase involved in cell wall biosynthesis